MSTANEHPLVTAYLTEFDAASAALPGPRRAVLREEIAAHLSDATAVGMPEAAVAAAIADLGSPAQIIGEEGVTANATLRGGWARTLLIVVAVAVGVLALLAAIPILYSLTSPQQNFAPALWAIGGLLVLGCVALSIVATRRSRFRS